MKFKKLCAALLSGVFAFGSIAVSFPYKTEIITSDYISDTVNAASVMRRPCSADNPMLIVHIDTWNVADPAKIISLIPEDKTILCIQYLNVNQLEQRYSYMAYDSGRI